jgi:hypothetical protein
VLQVAKDVEAKLGVSCWRMSLVPEDSGVPLVIAETVIVNAALSDQMVYLIVLEDISSEMTALIEQMRHCRGDNDTALDHLSAIQYVKLYPFQSYVQHIPSVSRRVVKLMVHFLKHPVPAVQLEAALTLCSFRAKQQWWQAGHDVNFIEEGAFQELSTCSMTVGVANTGDEATVTM